MKKLLRFAVVISIIFTMLSGNIAVMAAEVVEKIDEQAAVVETTNETTTTEDGTPADSTTTQSTEQNVDEEVVEETTDQTTETEPKDGTESEVPETEQPAEEGTETENVSMEKSLEIKKAETSTDANADEQNAGIMAISTELPERDPISQQKGSLELKIDLRLPQQKANANSLTVTLTKGSVITSSEKSTGKADEKQLFYTFNDLEPSTENEKYSISISGAGYQSYEATGIDVKANTTTVLEFTNGYDAVFVDPTTGESMGTGIIRIGDVDGSKDVTDKDITAVLNKIEGTESYAGYNYNLNQDKDEDGNDIIDIVDLSYAVINKGNKYVGPGQRFITNINMDTVKSIEPTQGTYYTGPTDPDAQKDPTLATDIKEILENNDKHVTLQPDKADEEISVENPIEIGLDIGQNTAETEYISIEPSTNANNNITEGIITVSGYDYKNDKAVEIPCEIEVRPQENSQGNQATSRATESIRGKNLKVAYAGEEIEYEPTEGGKAWLEADGSITVDFGSQIAVKRVIIKVTGTKGKKLADIAKVEFLNGMDDKIPEPQLGVPELRTTEIDESVNEEGFTVRWNNVPNVTGYRVIVRAMINGQEVTEVHEVDGHEYQMMTFNGGKFIKDLMNQNNYNDFTKYYVSVYSINGEWQSKPSVEHEVQPRPTSKPQPVTGVTAKAGYQLIKVTWNADRRASDYFVYYRKADEKDAEWKLASTTTEEDDIVLGADGKIVPGKTQKVKKGIKETSYTIQNLENEVKYEVMVRARNFIGMSDDSETSMATTLNVQEVQLPNYRRINKPEIDESTGDVKRGELTPGIKAAWHSSSGQFSMRDSTLDEGVDKQNNLCPANGVVDNSYSSYFASTDWDAGGFYDANDKGIIVEFEKAHKMNYLTFAKVQWTGTVQYATLRYRDTETNKTIRVRASLVAQRKDKDGHYYMAVKLARPITTDRLVIGIGGGSGDLTVAEMAFYDYDPIEDEINDLFADNMHITLADDIDVSTEAGKKAANERVDKIEAKLNTPDESGEINPEAENLKKELATAKKLIEKGDLGKVTKINSTMSLWYDTKSNDNNKDVEFRTSLNAWQPLGVSARSGEEITVYVGNPYKVVGDTTRLQLIFTQWRAEVGSWQSTVISPLQVGANTITLPDLITTNRERGGSLYINYTGLKDDEPNRFMDREYAVRVDGGNEIPVLDLSTQEVPDTVNYGAASRVELTEKEKQSRIEKYIEELSKTVSSLEKRHNEECMKCTDKYDVQEYGNGSDCILTATEIVMDDMMYSVSSKQIWDGLTEKGYKSNDEKVKGLTKSLTAMEDMMELFYNQKGLSKEGTAKVEYKDTFPRSRQNIRCMRMTGTAFMYAGGLHIGIQWNEVKDLAKGVPFTVDKDGKITGKGNYFGWGIAHEIGHVINQKAYVHGEVTNNYFSILAQTDNTRDTVRFDYKDVYDKVTSAKIGKSQNVFTQLGLYWQLHLAYDNGGYNYKKYDTAAEQLKNSIFARMDTYARDTSRAPKKEIALKLVDGDSDNNLMRLACAATEKNVLEFFKRWGMEPNEETVNYAKQFPDETKAIYYVNDESRNYVLEDKPELEVNNNKLTAQITTKTNKGKIDGNRVEFSFNYDTDNKDGILGYEIVRSYMEGDNTVSRTVAFVENGQNTYTDVVSTINNRAFTYKVVAYDKYLNKIAEKELEPVKVSHKGEIDKDGWVVTTNATSDTDKKIENDTTNKQVDTSDETQVISGVSALADEEFDVFNASTEDGKDVEIVVELPEVKKLVGLKYFADEQINNYEIQVKAKDSEEWITVKSSDGNSVGEFKDGEETLYFTKVGEDGKNEIYNYDYDAAYVKFIIHNSSIAIKELDLIGQTGDNVEFNDEGSIGLNKSEFVYDASKGYSIPKDAVIFTGKYKGNPAYNVVVMWYQEEGSDEWQRIDGYQVILADDPGEANLGETNEGNWVYVVEPQAMDTDGQYIDGEKNPFYEKIKEGKGKVRAELYRVDDAITLDGERVVSDTLVTKLPETLGNITLTDDRTNK